MFERAACKFLSLVAVLHGLGCTSADDASGGGGAASAAGGGAVSSTGGAGGGGASASGGASGSSGSGSGSGGVTVGGTAGAAATGGASGTPGGAGQGGAGGLGGAGGAGDGTLRLSSPNLAEGTMFAAKYTCSAAGFNGSLSPALMWSGAPAGTKSFAITFIDVTLTGAEPPQDNGYHWVIWDIPASTLGLPEELKDASTVGAKQNRAYLGPCPNFSSGSETHSYEFTLYALASETLVVTPATGIEAVKDARAKLEASHLASAKLSGTSNASPP